MVFCAALPLFLLGLLLPEAHAAVNWAELLDQSGGNSVRFGAGLDGKEPFRRNFEESFAPASTVKLFTAGAVLAALGPQYRYPTTLSWEEPETGVATDLTLTGTGDPSWGMPQFGENHSTRVNLIAEGLKNAGVHTVRGELEALSADPRWDSVSVPAGWKEDDSFSCGGALALGFNVNLNCVTYSVTAPARGAWALPGITAQVSLNIKPGNATSLTIKLVKGVNRPGFLISGTLKNGDTRSWTLPVFETRGWVKALMKQALLDKGIRLLPEKTQRKKSMGGERSLVFYSPPLSELLKPFLKNSVNFLGDALIKTLAADPGASAGGDLLLPGLEAMKSYLLRIGMPRDFLLHDGSGLSRISRCSPQMLLEFLGYQRRESFFPVFLEALAVAAVDGTLRNRMGGTAAASRLRGKTGTLDGVYNLAGYVPDGKESVPFVMLTRTTADKAAIARNAEDRVGARLAALHKSRGEEDTAQIQPYPYVPEQAGMDDQ